MLKRLRRARSDAVKGRAGRQHQHSLNSLAAAINAVSTAQGDKLAVFGQQLNRLIVSNETKLDALGQNVEQRLEAIHRETSQKQELARQDYQASSKDLRDEVGASLRNYAETLTATFGELSKAQSDRLNSLAERFDRLAASNDNALDIMRRMITESLRSVQEASTHTQLAKDREESSASSKALREEVVATLTSLSEATLRSMRDLAALQEAQHESFTSKLARLTETNEAKLAAVKESLEQQLARLLLECARQLDQTRTETTSAGSQSREELRKSLKEFNDSVLNMMASFSDVQKAEMQGLALKLEALTETYREKLDFLRTAVEQRLRAIQEDNGKHLDQMRATVDEKLQGTLDKRLGESFKQVSDRLEAVYKGLGEMQTLASGVGDLKKVLGNVKTRGTWGEVQLGAMLDQVLTPDQFVTNIVIGNRHERVEFAVKLPGRGEDHDDRVLLPIDAKFPMEDYQRLVEAQEKVMESRLNGPESSSRGRSRRAPWTSARNTLVLRRRLTSRFSTCLRKGSSPRFCVGLA